MFFLVFVTIFLAQVRETAKQVGRVLIRLSVRFCDASKSGKPAGDEPSSSEEDPVVEALRLLLPLFLDKGIISQAKEVRAVSLAALLEVTRVAGVHLKQFLPTVLGGLLEQVTNQGLHMASASIALRQNHRCAHCDCIFQSRSAFHTCSSTVNHS